MVLLKIFLSVYAAGWNKVFDISDTLRLSAIKQYELLRILLRLWNDAPRLLYFSLKRDSVKTADCADGVRASIEELLAKGMLPRKSARHLERMVAALRNISNRPSEESDKLVKNLTAYYERGINTSAISPQAKV